MPRAGLSIFGDERYRHAAQPLFGAGEVEAIEWTLDSWRVGPVDEETASYLKSFGERGLLVGHGVHYPLLSSQAEKLRASWLEQLRQDVQSRSYHAISVHFGFSTGWHFSEGAPMPVPYCREAVETGKKAMSALAGIAGCKVGIENLALAFSLKDVEEQGNFIRELLRDVNGYLLLDLHNVYCQAVNFGIDILEIVKTYPLELVEEIHVSGGSWSEHGLQHRKVRRDTHNGRIPEEVLEALPAVIALCPHVQSVMFEKLPQSFIGNNDGAEFREDFRRMKTAMRPAHG